MELTRRENSAVDFFTQAFGLVEESIQPIHRGEGLVFEACRDDLPLILKIIPSVEDIANEVKAQLHWCHILAANGLLVPDPIESIHGRLIERLIIERCYYTSFAYPRIPVTPQNQIDWKDPTMPRMVGETLGKMHCLARSYQPPMGGCSLGEGDTAAWLTHPEGTFHPSQSALFAPITRLRQTLAGFPRSPEHYGVIHDDFHTGNIFYTSGQIAVLDFGCCHKGWFAQDLSTTLLFRVWIAPEKEALKDQAIDFLKKLIQGYSRQADFHPEWLPMFPALLKLRELSLYQSFYRQVDLATAKDDGLFQYLFTSIRDERPFLAIDFKALDATGCQ